MMPATRQLFLEEDDAPAKAFRLISLPYDQQRRDRLSLEHAVLHRRRLRESGCLHPASGWLWLVNEKLRAREGRSYSDAQRESLIAALEEACLEASVPNWDGHGALPVNERAKALAADLVATLPRLRSQPEVVVDPDGSIGFDWQKAADQILSLSLSGEGMLAYAALQGRNRSRGTLEFSPGHLPKIVSEFIELIA